MKFALLWATALPFAALAAETPVGTLGNSHKIFEALLDSGAEMKSTRTGHDSIDLIRATNLVCRFESSPDLDANCTFFTKGQKDRVVKGIASSENSWMIGFALIAAGARKTQISETLSEVQVRSLICNIRNSKNDSNCIFMQEE